MATARPNCLSGRRLIALSGEDANAWLDNLVAGDLEALNKAPVVFTALLSPQGKILFEFFVWMVDGALLIDIADAQFEGFIKRLRMYKLRSRVEIREAADDWVVIWGSGEVPGSAEGAFVAVDPRAKGGLWRGLRARSAPPISTDSEAYLATRVRLGVGEAPDDYALGDVFPHEANMDLFGGVSFTKGCYVGQEVVSRMQNKTVVRKRVVRVASDEPLVQGADVTVGDAVIGRIGSVAGRDGLAMLRLDRAVEALDRGLAIMSDSHVLRVDSDALDRYRQSVKDRPVVDL